ncbi:hypothetical protein M514_01106 [Trichuris suis]|uniref:Uncharacterized protein n=1 Tax=Trichuris suis TaxID=68888 RepID=A0A085MKX7_9BILA|nr:hypothetical protein M513_01106 [Trichuris suis]KFD62589.1 hypothetical protein M514_01106 [Trichuris suis]
MTIRLALLPFPYLFLSTLLCLPVGNAVPQRKSEPWTILLCNFKDHGLSVQNAEWFDRWFNAEDRDGSIAQYFRDVSNGMYQPYAAAVLGWFRIQVTPDDVRRMVIEKGGASDLERQMALKTKDLCVEYAFRRHGFLPSSKVVTFVDGLRTALFCPIRGILLSPQFFMSTALTHEITHSFHIGHSFSDRKVKIYPHGDFGEYDDLFDLMSTGNAYSYKTAYGLTGPGLNGPHLDYLGWLPFDRILFYNASTQKPGIFRLSSLRVEKSSLRQKATNLRNPDIAQAFFTAPVGTGYTYLWHINLPHHTTKHWLLLLIPYDRDDPQKVFTVELRTPARYDKGLPAGGLLVHQIESRNNFYYSVLLSAAKRMPNRGTQWRLVNPAMRNAFILIETLGLWGSEATVKITSNFTPTVCSQKEAPRLVFGKQDLVCVAAPARSVAMRAVLEQKGRTLANGECKMNFIRYTTLSRQKICLTRNERATIAEQDGRWKRYQNFYQSPTYGLNMCKRGYVWRAIDPYDYVCVTPKRRREILMENEMALNRTDEHGDCKNGFVFRNAFPGDLVCLRKEQRTKAELDNSLNELRLRYFKFFNGVDEMTPNLNVLLARASSGRVESLLPWQMTGAYT